MPKYSNKIPDGTIEDIQAAGLNPADYVFDEENQLAVHRNDVPLSAGENVAEFGKSILHGLAAIPAGIPELAGATADAIRSARGTYNPNDPSDFTKLGKAIRGIVPEQDPRFNRIAAGVGSGIGMGGELLTGSALSSGIRKLAPALAATAATGGFGQQEVERELAERGQVAPGKFFGKLAADALLNTAVNDIGLGRVTRSMGTPVANRLRNIAENIGIGAGTGGVQAGTESALATGSIDPNAVIEGATVGGVVQPLIGSAVDISRARMNKPAVPLENKYAAKPKVAPAEPVKPPTPRLSDSEIEFRLRMPPGELPPRHTDFDKAVDEARGDGYVRTKEDVRFLEDAYLQDGPDAKTTPKLNAAMRELWMRHQASQPKPSAEEAAGAMKTGYYDFFSKAFPKETAEIKLHRKRLDDMEKWFAKEGPNLPAGEAVAAKDNIAKARASVQQRAVDLLRRWNDMHSPAERGMVVADKMGQHLGGSPAEYTGQPRPTPIIDVDPINIAGELPAPEQQRALPGVNRPLELPQQAGGPIIQPNGELRKLLPQRAGESSTDYAKRIGYEAWLHAKGRDNPAILRGMDLKYPEGQNISPELSRALSDYYNQMEGEQRNPFSPSGEPPVRGSILTPGGWRRALNLSGKTKSGLTDYERKTTKYRPAEEVSPEQRAKNLENFMAGSVVRDKDFQPKVVYHVTMAAMPADMFDVTVNPNELGAHFGSLETVNNLRKGRKTVVGQENANIRPVYLSLKNPVRLPDLFPFDEVKDIPYAKSQMVAAGTDPKAAEIVVDYLQRVKEGTAESTAELRQALRKAGFDGVVYDNKAEGGGDSYIVFDPRQIKSASGNVGTFDAGHPSTRYSSILTPSMLSAGQEALRKLRRWITPEQRQEGTFMLSGVAGLNHDRPFGMMLTGEGKLPVSGLVNKLDASIPKGEMEMYRAAGLEEWLKGRGNSVSKEELQDWMIENGPRVEVKKLVPTVPGKDIYSVWRDKEAQLRHEAETQGWDFSNQYEPRFSDGTIAVSGDGDTIVGRRRNEDLSWETVDISDKPGFDAVQKLLKHRSTWTPELQQQAEQQGRAGRDSTIGRYEVEPRPLEELKEPVEVLVRVPLKPEIPYRWSVTNPNTGEVTEYDNYRAAGYEAASSGGNLEQVSGFRDKPLWTGGHHGESGHNALAFVRGNMETLPDGRRVFHAFEVQSDWGGIDKVRTGEHVGEYQTSDGKYHKSFGDAEKHNEGRHKLLKDYNRLALKAAIQHAIDNGADGLAISDPETAMITEGHDAAGSMVRRVSPDDLEHMWIARGPRSELPGKFGDDWRAGTYVTVDRGGHRAIYRLDKPTPKETIVDRRIIDELNAAGYGAKEGPYIPQEAGMRMNYGQKLPSIAEELTGHKGERVSFGEHWKTQGTEPTGYFIESPDGTRRGPYPHGEAVAFLNDGDKLHKEFGHRENLIFKNPDGSPKTDISANYYPLDKVRKMQAEQAAFTLFGKDKAYYSRFGPGPESLKEFRKFLGRLFPNADIEGSRDINPFYIIGKSTTSRMAQDGPSGGAVAELFSARLESRRDSLANQVYEQSAPAERFMKSAEGKQWADWAEENRTDDTSMLSPEQRKGAEALIAARQFTRDFANDHNILVAEVGPDGRTTYREGSKVPGWQPADIGEQVFRAAQKDGAEWRKLKEDFRENWEKHRGAGTAAEADTAIEGILPSLGGGGRGGEPLFSPVILPQGIPLPKSWRSPSAWDSWTHYVKRWSQHVAWAMEVQNRPIGRALFGLKQDAAGRPHEPIKWTDVPDAWQGAVREGRRAQADWALQADPFNPPDEPVERYINAPLTDAMMMGYRMGSGNSAEMNALNQVASPILMGPFSGLRDLAQGISTANVYGGFGETIGKTLDYVTGGRSKMLGSARRGGAMQGDLLAPEGLDEGRLLAKGLNKLARGMRAVTGRAEMDQMGKAIIYEAVKAKALAGDRSLIEEFGPVDRDMPLEDLIELTAARLTRRASGVSSPSNLPPSMLPQSGTARSKYFGLMRWSLAKTNSFIEDVIHPMLQGKGKLALERGIKEMLGGLVAGSAVNGFINWLMDKKPDHLTWGEFLNVYNDPAVPPKRKAEEFAYAALANMQLSGTLGWAGDAALAGVRAGVGGKGYGGPLDIQYPAVIVGLGLANLMASYGNAVKNGRADSGDFFQLLWEMVKLSQNGKILNRAMEASGAIDKVERKAIRNQQVFERITGLETSRRGEVAPESGIKMAGVVDPFAFAKQAMRADSAGEWNRLQGFVQDVTRKTHRPPTLRSWKQDRQYYENVGRIIGPEEALLEKARDEEMEKIVKEKNRKIRELSR